MFDFSDYPADHFCYSAMNKKVMGKFKDELSGIPIVECMGLRAKTYSLLDCSGNEKKRAKGVKKIVVANRIKHKMYKKVLRGGIMLKHTMKYIRSDTSTGTSVVQNKLAYPHLMINDTRFMTAIVSLHMVIVISWTAVTNQ